MSTEILNLVSWVLIVAGSAFCIVGALGLLRMPDFFTRMHAASLVDTLGAGLLLLGMIVQAGLTLVTAKLLMIALLLFFTSPTATHALARAARARGVEPLLADESGPLLADESEPLLGHKSAPLHADSKPSGQAKQASITGKPNQP